MRIRLDVSSDKLEWIALVKAPGYRMGMSFVRFIVDTGSNRSMIGYSDVVRFNLPQSSLTFSENSYIGGTSLKLHRLDDVTLMEDEPGNQMLRLKTQCIFASTPSKKNESERIRAKNIPSIIGLDFLNEQGIGLYCNPSRKEAYLELA